MPKKKTSSNNECRYIVRSDKTSRLAIAMSWIWFFVQITFRRAPVNYFNHAGWFESKPPRKIQAAYRAPTTAADNTRLRLPTNYKLLLCLVHSNSIYMQGSLNFHLRTWFLFVYLFEFDVSVTDRHRDVLYSYRNFFIMTFQCKINLLKTIITHFNT